MHKAVNYRTLMTLMSVCSISCPVTAVSALGVCKSFYGYMADGTCDNEFFEVGWEDLRQYLL